MKNKQIINMTCIVDYLYPSFIKNKNYTAQLDTKNNYYLIKDDFNFEWKYNTKWKWSRENDNLKNLLIYKHFINTSEMRKIKLQKIKTK